MKSQITVKDGKLLAILSHPTRFSIICIMGEEPITLSGISRALGEKPGKIRFHLMKLLEAGLIRHVEDKVVGGNVEKYYQATSSTIAIEKPDEQFDSLEERRQQALTVVQILMRKFQERLLRDDCGNTFFSQMRITIPQSALNSFIKDYVAIVQDNLLNRWKHNTEINPNELLITVDLASFISKVLPFEEE